MKETATESCSCFLVVPLEDDAGDLSYNVPSSVAARSFETVSFRQMQCEKISCAGCIGRHDWLLHTFASDQSGEGESTVTGKKNLESLEIIVTQK